MELLVLMLVLFALVGALRGFGKRVRFRIEGPLKPRLGDDAFEDIESHGRGVSARRAEALNDSKATNIQQGGIVTFDAPKAADDPIFGLGLNPVECGAADASENLDRYLYAADE